MKHNLKHRWNRSTHRSFRGILLHIYSVTRAIHEQYSKQTWNKKPKRRPLDKPSHTSNSCQTSIFIANMCTDSYLSIQCGIFMASIACNTLAKNQQTNSNYSKLKRIFNVQMSLNSAPNMRTLAIREFHYNLYTMQNGEFFNSANGCMDHSGEYFRSRCVCIFFKTIH